MSYDSRCFDLAETFLSEEPGINGEEARDELAQLIQTTIEDWINYYPHRNAPPPANDPGKGAEVASGERGAM